MGESFYGQSLKTRAEAHFSIAERAYPPFFQTPQHVHTKPLIVLVLNGSYYETHHGRTRYCTPATLLFHAAFEGHLERFEKCGGRSLIVEIDPQWLERMCESARIHIEATAAFESGALSLLGSRLYKEFHTTDQASSLVIEGIMAELAGEVARAGQVEDRRPPRWLEQTRELLREQYASRLSLSDLATTVDVHPVHLAQAFRRFYRCTIGDYVRTQQIEFACRELTFSETPLAEIARRAGFADPSHFTRTFKQRVGVLPSQFREAARLTRTPFSKPRPDRLH
jgi:AraC family transcriptional regulator